MRRFMPKPNDQPVITPEKVLGDVGFRTSFGRVIIVFTDRALEECDKILSDKVEVKTLALKTLKGQYGGCEIFCSKFHAGAPLAVMDLECHISLGGSFYIVVGEAGAISPDIKIGDLILPTWGLREEGVSYHYAREDYVPRPSPELLERLEKVLVEERLNYFKGGVWSTDAPFLETKGKVKDYGEMGILAVDMESTALMTVAEYRSVELALLLAVSDELYHEEWRSGFNFKELDEAERKAVRLAVKALTGS